MHTDPDDCPRCGSPMETFTGSWFTADDICLDCSQKEKAHPDYRYARRVVIAAEQEGEMNHPGVGWPGTGKRVPKDSA